MKRHLPYPYATTTMKLPLTMSRNLNWMSKKVDVRMAQRVAFTLHTQRPRVWISALPFFSNDYSCVDLKRGFLDCERIQRSSEKWQKDKMEHLSWSTIWYILMAGWGQFPTKQDIQDEYDPNKEGVIQWSAWLLPAWNAFSLFGYHVSCYIKIINFFC